MTTDELSLLVAETRCDHGHLTLEDAQRTGDDWTVYLRATAHPCPYKVRDYQAYQTHVPALPAAWLVPRTRPERHGRDYSTAPGDITLPQLAQLLAAVPARDADPAWQLYAIHRTGDAAAAPAVGDATYLVEGLDPTTAEVRPFASRAAYQRARRPDSTGLSARASLPAPRP